tara:strand:+ start:518 stop:775 length:258 start_codon:yes stop_codon:yes gene_type:complete
MSTKYNNETFLEIIELYAIEVGLISSQDELSEQFDQYINDCFPNFPVDDEPALNEAFNNWADSLCKDGIIHPEQYNQYDYTGIHQ